MPKVRLLPGLQSVTIFPMPYVLLLLFLVSCSTTQPPQTYPQAWTFSKTMEIRESSLFLDGKAYDNFACPFSDKRDVVAIAKTKNINFTVLCYDDYLGGYFLEESLKPIAQSDGDAGEHWDTQSLFFHHKGQLILWKSYHKIYPRENSKKANYGCHKTDHFFKWNSKTKTFAKTNYKGPLPKRQFPPFELYTKYCS